MFDNNNDNNNISIASLGIKLSTHEHPLHSVKWEDKGDDAYQRGFICSECRNTFRIKDERYNLFCIKCEYDICEKCLYKYENKNS